jgi:SAM-dependent methyltransferase
MRLLHRSTGPEPEADFFLSRFRSLAVTGDYPRVLIAASADTGMLELLQHAYEGTGSTLSVTLVDLCDTPLRLNAWYGRKCGISIETVKASVLEFDRQGEFDIICTHSLLSFIEPSRHVELFSRWFESLRSGGCLITSQSLRPDRKETVVTFKEKQVEPFVARAVAVANEMGLALPPDSPGIESLARDFFEAKSTYTISSPTALRKGIESAGFRLAHFEPIGEQLKRYHRESYPGPTEGWTRFQIDARKP